MSVFEKHERILCSVSGGSDSDLLVDFCRKLDPEGKKVTYVFYDTGLEYQATKKHLSDLEKSGITIHRQMAKMPIPLATRIYGQPFMNKRVAEYIHRLQLHDFNWQDKPYEELIKEYPRCHSALMWWCNKNKAKMMNIENNKYLKEFIIDHPPTFPISSACCQKAKKDTAHQLEKEMGFDLVVLGIRKSEGGVRSVIPSCYTKGSDKADVYRPLFWFSSSDKALYEELFNIQHSCCYTEYGFKRTGCCCCPFGRDVFHELSLCETYEPALATAVKRVFAQSLSYTKAYMDFCEAKRTA